MITADELSNPEWNAERQRLEEALLQAANELTTFTKSSRAQVQIDGVIRVTVVLETYNKKAMQ
jgi:hypothetical protein